MSPEPSPASAPPLARAFHNLLLVLQLWASRIPLALVVWMGSESDAERSRGSPPVSPRPQSGPGVGGEPSCNPGEIEPRAGEAPRGDPIDISNDEDSDSPNMQLEEHWLFCSCSNGAYLCVHMGNNRLATQVSFCCVCGRPLCTQCSWEARSPLRQQLHECCSCRWAGRHDEMEAEATDDDYWPSALERGACSDEPEIESSSGLDT